MQPHFLCGKVPKIEYNKAKTDMLLNLSTKFQLNQNALCSYISDTYAHLANFC